MLDDASSPEGVPPWGCVLLGDVALGELIDSAEAPGTALSMTTPLSGAAYSTGLAKNSAPPIAMASSAAQTNPLSCQMSFVAMRSGMEEGREEDSAAAVVEAAEL